MSDLPVCAGCDKPIRDNAFLCHRCTALLERDLGDVAALASEVQTTRLRLSRTGGQAIGGGHSSERPLPWDERPVKAARALREVLARWAGLVVEQRGGAFPPAHLGALSAFLMTHLPWLRQREEVLLARQEIRRTIGRLRFSVDRRTTQVYAGPCGAMDYAENGDLILCSMPCAGDVYAQPKADVAKCQVCGATHDVKDRREWLLEAVDDQLAHPALITKALSSLGMPVPEATIRSWVDRKRLVAHGEDGRGRKVYRIGDVRELVTAEAVRVSERAGKATRRSA